jgi:hypothetical protein
MIPDMMAQEDQDDVPLVTAGEEVQATLFEEGRPTELDLFEGTLPSQHGPSTALGQEQQEEACSGEGLNGPTSPLFGTDLFGNPLEPGRSKGKLGDLFVVPPFTVLDTRQGYWQDRKRAWCALGIRSELGRAKDAMGASASSVYSGTSEWSGVRGPREHRTNPGGNLLKFSPAMAITRNGQGYNGGKIYDGSLSKDGLEANSTSIFDPVLCELCYRWFCPEGGLVLDPFAGGSVRGIMAGLLNRRYFGIDLREEQVEANRIQHHLICPHCDIQWKCGDSRTELPNYRGEMADFVFSCPPYADLERYSDLEADLSTMEYDQFLEAYRDIVAWSIVHLKPNRFAAFVVSELRTKDKHGSYRGFVRDTIAAFEDAGARFYNEAVLINAIGSLPLRVQKQFNATRKLGRTHQYLLVFVKGDPRKAAEAIPLTETVTRHQDAEREPHHDDGAEDTEPHQC